MKLPKVNTYKKIATCLSLIVLGACVSTGPETPQEKLHKAASPKTDCRSKILMYDNVIDRAADSWKTDKNGKYYATPEQLTQAIAGIKATAPSCPKGDNHLKDAIITLLKRKDPRANDLYEIFLQNMKNSGASYRANLAPDSWLDWRVKQIFAQLSENLDSDRSNRMWEVATKQGIFTAQEVNLIKKMGSKEISKWMSSILEIEIKAAEANQAKNDATSKTNNIMAVVGALATVAGSVDSRNAKELSNLGSVINQQLAQSEADPKKASMYSDLSKLANNRAQNSCKMERKTLQDAIRHCNCDKGQVRQEKNMVACKRPNSQSWDTCVLIPERGTIQCATR